VAVAPTSKDVVEALTATLVTVLDVTDVGAVGVRPSLPPHETTDDTIRQTTAPAATVMGSV
jgi:hypothetical protein